MRRVRLSKSAIFSIALTLLLSTLSITSTATAQAGELPTAACKLSYTYSGINTLGFPRNPDRLPNLSPHKQLFVAVDFPDARYNGDATELIERVMRPKSVVDFFLFNSYGKVKMDYYIYPEIVTLPNNSVTYGGDKSKAVLVNGVWSNDLIHRAALKIIDEKMDLSSFSAMATLVTKGETLSQTGGLASPWSPGSFTFKNGSFNNASLIGGGLQIEDKNPELWHTRWLVVAHEIGHLFGFTDIYMYNGDYYKGYTPGPFDVMNAVGSWAPTFTAWNRWLIDWVTDKEVICFDKNDLDSEVKITAVNEESGTKAAVIRLSSSKAIVIESRRTDKYDFLGPDEGLFVYTVDMNVKSGEGALRAVPESNQFTDQAITRDIGDTARFLTGTLRAGEYLVHEGVLIENIGSAKTTDTVRISTGTKATEREKLALQRKQQRAAEFEKVKAEAQKAGNFYMDGSCHATGSIATFQVLEGDTWKDKAQAETWIEVTSCPDLRKWKPAVIAELNSFTSYRWKIQSYNPNIIWYSNTGKSPQTQADALAEVQRKAEELAKAEAAAQAKAAAEKAVVDAAKLDGTYYEDDGCHALGTTATFQTQVQGEWRDFQGLQGWATGASCAFETPRRPWIVASLASETPYRWKITAPGWSSDWYSRILLSPVTKADLEARAAAAALAAKANSSSSKKIVITCIKGKSIKKISGVNPKCPKGYKKK